MQIAKAILELRIEAGLSQDELAERLFVSRELVSKWELGMRRPTRPMIERLAEVFGVLPETIVQEEEPVIRELQKCLSENSPLSKSQLVPILNRFLDQLRTIDADIFMQRYYFAKSTTDIASHFHMKENHVRTTLSRIRKKLKRFIKEVTYESK